MLNTRKFIVFLGFAVTIVHGKSVLALDEEDLKQLRLANHCVECDLTGADFFQTDLRLPYKYVHVLN